MHAFCTKGFGALTSAISLEDGYLWKPLFATGLWVMVVLVTSLYGSDLRQ